MIVLDDSDYVCVKEYILFLKDELVDIFFDEQEIRSICTKTNCQIELTNRILNRKIGGFKIIKYAIIQIKGKDDFSIRQCNRLLEQRCPHYRKRQEYNKKAYCCTLFPEESLPDNAQLYFQYQRSGATKYQFGKVLLKSPFETNHRRPLNDCYWKTNDCDLKKGILVSSTKQTENYFSRYLKNNLSSQEAYKDDPYSNLYFTNPVEVEEPNKPFNPMKLSCKSRNLRNYKDTKNVMSEVQIEPVDEKDIFERSKMVNGEVGHRLIQYETKQIKNENSLMLVNTFHVENNSPVNESLKPLIDVLVIEEYSDYNNLRNTFQKGETVTSSIEVQSNRASFQPQNLTQYNQQRLSNKEKYEDFSNKLDTSEQNEMNIDIVENIQYNDVKSSVIDINFGFQTLNSADEICNINIQDFSVANKYDQTNFQVTVGNVDLNKAVEVKSVPSYLSEQITESVESPRNMIQKQEENLEESYLARNDNDGMRPRKNNEMQIYMQNIITVHPYSDVTRDTINMNRLSNKGENYIFANAAMITQKIILSEEGTLVQDINYQRLENIDSESILLNEAHQDESRLVDNGNKYLLPNEESRKSNRLSRTRSKESKSSQVSTISASKPNEIEESNTNKKSIVKDEAQFLTRFPVQVQNTYETTEIPSISSPEFRVSNSEQFFGNRSLDKTDRLEKLNVVRGSKTSESMNLSQKSPHSNNKIKVRYQVRENGKIVEDRVLDETNNESRIFTDSESIQILSDNRNAPVCSFINDSGKNSSYVRFNANLNDSETSSIHLEMVIKDTYKKYLSELPISKTEADIESPLLEIPHDNSFRPNDSSRNRETRAMSDDTNRSTKDQSPKNNSPFYLTDVNIPQKCASPANTNPKKMVKCFSFTKEKNITKNDQHKPKNDKEKIEKKYKLPRIDKVTPVIHKEGSNDYNDDRENIKHNRLATKIDNQNNRKFDRSKKLMKINDSTNLEVMLMTVNSDEETLCELSGSQIISDVSNNAQKSANNFQKDLRKQNRENPALETLTKLDNLSGMDLLVQQLADKLLVDISCLSNENINYPEIREIDTESQSSETMFSMNFEIPIKNNQNSMKLKNNNSKIINNLQLLDTSMFSDISSFTYHPESRCNIQTHLFEETPMISPNSYLNNNFSNSSDCFPILVSKYFDDLKFSQELSYDNFLPLVNINKLKLNSNLQFAEINQTDRHFPTLESTDIFQSISGLKKFLNENSSTKQNYSIDKIFQSQILYRANEKCQIAGTGYKQFRKCSEKNSRRNIVCCFEYTNEIFHTEYRTPNIEVVFQDNSNRLFHQFPKMSEIDFNISHSLRNYHCTLKLVSPKILYKYKPDGNSKIPKLNKAMKQTGPISLFHEEFLNSTNQLEFYKTKSPFCPIESKTKDNSNMRKEMNISRSNSQRRKKLVTSKPIGDLNTESVLLTNTQYESSFSKITDWILRNNKYARG